MIERTAEDGLKLLNLAGISLPNNEVEVFKSEFKKVYEPSEERYDFVETVWKVYSKNVPIEAYPDDRGAVSLRTLARDRIFQEKVVNSGISDKLKSGKSLGDLAKNAIK